MPLEPCTIQMEVRPWRRARRGSIVAALVSVAVISCCSALAEGLPRSKAGLVITHEELVQIREKIKSGVPRQIWQGVVKQLPQAIKTLQDLPHWEWPPQGANVDSASGYRKTLRKVKSKYFSSVPVVAMHYLVTGKTDGVEDALLAASSSASAPKMVPIVLNAQQISAAIGIKIPVTKAKKSYPYQGRVPIRRFVPGEADPGHLPELLGLRSGPERVPGVLTGLARHCSPRPNRS